MIQISNAIRAGFLITAISFSASALAAADDATVQQSVASRLAADKVTAGLNIQVDSKDDVVSLSGITNTDKEAAVAVELAESTPGVKEVNTANLKAKKSEHPLDDTLITAKVKGVFAKNKLFGDSEVPVTSINVETKNGVVYLTGKVQNGGQERDAASLARSVKGVKKVESKLVVDQTK